MTLRYRLTGKNWIDNTNCVHIRGARRFSFCKLGALSVRALLHCDLLLSSSQTCFTNKKMFKRKPVVWGVPLNLDFRVRRSTDDSRCDFWHFLLWKFDLCLPMFFNISANFVAGSDKRWSRELLWNAESIRQQHWSQCQLRGNKESVLRL